MTKNQNNDGVGDKLAPPLRQTGARMQNTADQSIKIPASASPKGDATTKVSSLAICMKNGSPSKSAAGSCVQTLWFTFFFDGTGNNLNADLGTVKHSNVAKLYRAHRGNEDNGGVEGKRDDAGLAIYDVLTNSELGVGRRGTLTQRSSLRPHYKILVDAYENEFIREQGLADKAIIAFFENYIHDSLAGFAKDATLPSDPRVVYIGGDEKLEEAQINSENDDQSIKYRA